MRLRKINRHKFKNRGNTKRGGKQARRKKEVEQAKNRAKSATPIEEEQKSEGKSKLSKRLKNVI